MTDLTGITIRVTDIKKAGICGRGARPFFADHGLSWSKFVSDGIPAQVLWDTGDGYARLVVTRKLEREKTTDG